MTNRKKLALQNVINFGLIFVLFLLRYTGIFVLDIGKATPIIVIPLIVAIAIYYGEFSGFLAGLFAGLLMDTQVIGSSCYNIFALMLLGLISGLCSTYMLNKNLKSAICLSFGATFLYFLFRYLILFVFKGDSLGFGYFSAYLIPSVVYTTIFIIPFYYLEKFLCDRS